MSGNPPREGKSVPRVFEGMIFLKYSEASGGNGSHICVNYEDHMTDIIKCESTYCRLSF